MVLRHSHTEWKKDCQYIIVITSQSWYFLIWLNNTYNVILYIYERMQNSGSSRPSICYKTWCNITGKTFFLLHSSANDSRAEFFLSWRICIWSCQKIKDDRLILGNSQRLFHFCQYENIDYNERLGWKISVLCL